MRFYSYIGTFDYVFVWTDVNIVGKRIMCQNIYWGGFTADDLNGTAGQNLKTKPPPFDLIK